MSPTPSTSPRHVRLRPTGDTPSIPLPLRAGTNRLGSAADNDLVIAHHGVSRHHAIITVDDEQVTVEDRESKNGTFVNGQRISRHVLVPGDELWLGPYALTLERFDPREDELAVRFELPDPSTARLGRAIEAPDPTPTRRWLLIATSFLEHLGHGRRPDLGGALHLLNELLGLDGAALYAVPRPRGTAVLLATARTDGRALRSLDPTSRVPPGDGLFAWHVAGPGDEAPAVDAETPATTWAWLRHGSNWLVLVLDGAFADRDACEPLLRLLLRAVANSHSPEPLAASGAVVSNASQAADTASPPALRWPAGTVPGTSRAARDLHRQLTPLTQGDLPVLITGPTGTGKELIARLLHRSTRGRTGAFVALNCAAMPADLLEAELFGVGKGVATGVTARPGLFERAHGGTLFLDEVGELPLALQPKLLRALQERTIMPLGGREQAVDVRILAATNQPLAAQATRGTFRADLYYRLAGAVVEVPPLHARRDDIPALVTHFLERHAEALDKPIRGISVPALDALVAFDWPGNVRQLENEVRRLVYRCPPRQAIESSMIAESILAPPSDATDDPTTTAPWARRLETLDLATIERAVVAEALRRTDGNQVRAGALLGISRTAVRRRIERHGLDDE